jgi:protein-L-isoaspartate(D-aspartate) O-methyltransferase
VSAEELERARERMVQRQVEDRGVRDPRVLAAMRAVPREAFVPSALRAEAFDDRALPIAEGQTISQPYVVAAMVEALSVAPGDRALEVGTGSGYAAAVLARLAAHVFTIERHAALARGAAERLRALDVRNVTVRTGDGSLGWPEEAPFDAILVSAGAGAVPPSLLDQLAPGGRLVIPVGASPVEQRLLRVQKGADGRVEETWLGGVRFVPLVGAEGWGEG